MALCVLSSFCSHLLLLDGACLMWLYKKINSSCEYCVSSGFSPSFSLETKILLWIKINNSWITCSFKKYGLCEINGYILSNSTDFCCLCCFALKQPPWSIIKHELYKLIRWFLYRIIELMNVFCKRWSSNRNNSPQAYNFVSPLLNVFCVYTAHFTFFLDHLLLGSAWIVYAMVAAAVKEDEHTIKEGMWLNSTKRSIDITPTRISNYSSSHKKRVLCFPNHQTLR